MTEEDEAFNDIERQAKQRKESVKAAMRAVEDDDIQVYQRPWVGLTDEEMLALEETTTCTSDESWLRNLTRNIEAKLKELNT